MSICSNCSYVTLTLGEAKVKCPMCETEFSVCNEDGNAEKASK